MSRETVRDKILKVLRAEAASRSPVGLSPKIITARIPKDAEGKKPSVGSVKGTLSRMLGERSVLKDHDGYKIVPGSFEAAINVSLESEIAVENLPRVHDVQLMFRREDVPKVTGKNNDLAVTLRKLATQVEYSNQDRPPVSKKSDKTLINGYKGTGCLSPSPLAEPRTPGQAPGPGGSVGIDFIDRIFNPMDPFSIIQLFYKPERARADEGRPRNQRKYLLDGGFREKYHTANSDLIFHFYWSGNITITISCSETPMGSAEFHGALCKVDGIFEARTGLSWWDIQDFFFVHMVHVGTDSEVKQELAGVYDMCWTSKQIDGTLERVYRKVFPNGETKIRHEVCHQDGNIEEHQVSDLQRMLDSVVMGGPSIANLNASTYVNIKETRKLQDMMGKLAGRVAGHDQAIAQIVNLFGRYQEQLAQERDQMAQLLKTLAAQVGVDSSVPSLGEFHTYSPKSPSAGALRSISRGGNPAKGPPRGKGGGNHR